MDHFDYKIELKNRVDIKNNPGEKNPGSWGKYPADTTYYCRKMLTHLELTIALTTDKLKNAYESYFGGLIL